MEWMEGMMKKGERGERASAVVDNDWEGSVA